MPALHEIPVTKLMRLIGTPDCPLIADVSTDDDFAADPHLIPGAFRHQYRDLAGLAQLARGRRIVVVCQKGRKLSQGAVAWLRGDGTPAEYLSGGNHGWRDAPGSDRVPSAAIPAPQGEATLWVTRHRPKIDRIACPWLIRRFVDRDARFLFVAPSEVAGVAERFGATPFDVEGVPLSHRGPACTFDTMLDTFGLGSPALRTMAGVIRAADTNRHADAAQAAGLLAISVGLSRLHSDDQKQLAAGIALYDALYHWARDGQSEGHDWMGTA